MGRDTRVVTVIIVNHRPRICDYGVDVKASRKDQLITVERGAAPSNSRAKREKTSESYNSEIFILDERETSAPFYILNALIRRSWCIRGGGRDEPTAFPTNALDENRLTSPADLVAKLLLGALSLIIYRTTDRSTPCWIIRGSSVGSATRKRRLSRRRRIPLRLESRSRSCAGASTETFESARTHTLACDVT